MKSEYEMMKDRASQPLLHNNPEYTDYECGKPPLIPSDMQVIRELVPQKISGVTESEYEKQLMSFYRKLGRTVAMVIGLKEYGGHRAYVEFIVKRMGAQK
jgi:hypothetical protein